MKLSIKTTKYAFLALLLFTIYFHTLDYVAAQNPVESQQVRRVVYEYTKAMNRKSVDEVVSLYTDSGKFVDESFDAVFAGSDQLRKLYISIFETNPKLTFTAYPWNIDISGDQASVTCSWSLVGEYGVFNGIYLISMSNTSNEWKIVTITAYITAVHNSDLQYLLLS